MKHTFFAAVLLFFTLQNSFGQNIFIFEKGGKFGLKNNNNKTIVNANFDYIHPLNDKQFLIEKDKKIGVVSSQGTMILDPIFDDVKNLNNADFIVTDRGKWGVVTNRQRIIVPLEYTGIDELSNFLYVVTKGNKKGLMDKSGRIVQPPYYDDISNLSDFILALKGGNTINLVDNLGNSIMSGNFETVEKLPVGSLYRVASGNKHGIIDLEGKLNIDPVYDEIDCSDPEFMILRKDGKVGFIINKTYIPATYDRILFIQKELGVIAVRKGNLNGFVTTDGLIIQPIYDNISRFAANGHAFVEKTGMLMYVDVKGKEKTLGEVTGKLNF